MAGCPVHQRRNQSVISYQRNIQGAALPCDAATFWHITDSRKVSDICQQIDQVVNGPTSDGRSYEQQTEEERRTRHDQAGLLKKQLPSFCFMATFPSERRLKSDAVPTGLVMLDVDGMDQPRQWYEQQAFTPQRLGELGIDYMGQTPSTRGLRVVFRAQSADIAREQQRMSVLLGVPFDPACKDLSRMSFAVPRSYIFYLNEEMFTIDNSQFTIDNSQLTPSSLRDTPSCEEGESCRDQASKAMLHPIAQPNIARQNCELSIVNCQLNYHGLPYAAIIDKYWELFNDGKKPYRGDRNLLTFELAVNLCHICGMDVDWLMQVIPCYDDFPVEEKRQTIVNAIAQARRAEEEGHGGMPYRLKRVLEALRPQPAATEQPVRRKKPSDDQADEQRQKQAADFERRLLLIDLPIGLKESIAGVPTGFVLPALCAALPIAAAYATHVTYVYCDGDWHRLNLMSVIAGRQASGKSVAKGVVDVWCRQMEASDAEARREEEAWRQRKKNRKANEKLPDEPQTVVRGVPVTISCSTLLKRLKRSGGQHLYSFGEELDTLYKTNRAGSWSSKYDCYRYAFDNAWWGQDYNSDQAESGKVSVAYNWTILGTYRSLRKCFSADEVEDGLVGRIIFCEMPDNRYREMPHYRRITPQEDERIQQAVRRLSEAEGTYELPRLSSAIEAWAAQRRLESSRDDDEVKDTFYKRSAVIGMRAGVLFYLLSDHPEGGGEGSDVSEACLDFARLVADFTLWYQSSLFGEVLLTEAADMESRCVRYTANKRFFDELPMQFRLEDVLGRRGLSKNEAAVRTMLWRWRKDGFVTYENGTYSKKMSQ